MMPVMNMLIANHRAVAKVFAQRTLTNVFQISQLLAIAMVTHFKMMILQNVELFLGELEKHDIDEDILLINHLEHM